MGEILCCVAMHKHDVCSLLLLALSRFAHPDLCEAECDSHPLRTHVGRVLQRSLGIDPASVTLEARFMVRAGATHEHTSPSCQRGRSARPASAAANGLLFERACVHKRVASGRG